jgi:PAS domain S-box-containing protein
MIAPPKAKNELDRLAFLQSYGILDTPAEKDFDDLVDLAANICGTPIALISLVDADRQWFKAAFGFAQTETPRDVSFCGHTILNADLFVVPDATRDVRFADNPLVIEDPEVRFYAGAPLMSAEGYALGALCVMDRQPRLLTRQQERALSILSRHVMAQLELRRQTKEMSRTNQALLGILEDERMAEAAKRESEELNRGVLDSVVAHIAVLDREGKIIAVNEAWRQFAHENTDGRQELLARTEVGINYLEACRTQVAESSSGASEVLAGLQAVLGKETETFTFEYPCHGPGKKRWFLLSATPLKTKKGGAVVSHLEITERKLAEQIIAEQADFLDKARDAILVRDLQGKAVYWNKGAERLYGWTREEVLGRDISELFGSDPKRIEEIEAVTISQGEWRGEQEHLTKDRRKLTVEASTTLIRDSEGTPHALLAIVTDITEKKRIEAQFMRAQRMESIGTLAGGIAHDLNNILAPIMMSIEILKEMSSEPQAAEILETIEVSARRGADIVRQVLSFARGLEGKRVEIQPKHLVKDLEKIIKDTFPKDIRLQFIVPSDTWTILGDPTQIHQILLNLCVNARDAMPNGGILRIEVDNCELDAHYAAMNVEAKPGRYVRICVTDSGSGIPPELTEKIFEPFFTTKDLNKGTGLGLSTVMTIVKSHEGVINVYSETGKGTTFRIYLPATQGPEVLQTENCEEANLPRGHGETVLVVDDESSILTITSQTLAAFGYQVLEATDGADAVATYAQHRNEIAVVLTDMMMPVMDGPATISALLRINPAAKIIAASGLNSNGGAEKLAAMGVNHLLTKPYTAHTLLKALRTILDEA